MKWDQVGRAVLLLLRSLSFKRREVVSVPTNNERDRVVLAAVQSLCMSRALLRPALRGEPIDQGALELVLRGLNIAENALLLLDDERRVRDARMVLK